MNIYSPSELVRLELLQYKNPEGIHPVEEAWRNLARKLAEDVKQLQEALTKHHGRVPADGRCFDCGLPKVVLGHWPEKFTLDHAIEAE